MQICSDQCWTECPCSLGKGKHCEDRRRFFRAQAEKFFISIGVKKLINQQTELFSSKFLQIIANLPLLKNDEVVLRTQLRSSFNRLSGTVHFHVTVSKILPFKVTISVVFVATSEVVES